MKRKCCYLIEYNIRNSTSYLSFQAFVLRALNRVSTVGNANEHAITEEVAASTTKLYVYLVSQYYVLNLSLNAIL